MYVYHTSITSSYIIHNYQFISDRQYLSTIFIYLCTSKYIINPSEMDCHVAAPQEIGPFLLNQSLKWSWHHPAGRFHTLTWGTAIDHQMKLGWSCWKESEVSTGNLGSFPPRGSTWLSLFIYHTCWFFLINLRIIFLVFAWLPSRQLQLTISRWNRENRYSLLPHLFLHAMIPQSTHIWCQEMS